jgi:hypothetical protein
MMSTIINLKWEKRGTANGAQSLHDNRGTQRVLSGSAGGTAWATSYFHNQKRSSALWCLFDTSLDVDESKETRAHRFPV